MALGPGEVASEAVGVDEGGVGSEVACGHASGERLHVREHAVAGECHEEGVEAPDGGYRRVGGEEDVREAAEVSGRGGGGGDGSEETGEHRGRRRGRGRRHRRELWHGGGHCRGRVMEMGGGGAGGGGVEVGKGEAAGESRAGWSSRKSENQARCRPVRDC